ncbi:outer membrane beta-barrel family protein [Dyadobacter frigoris]|nr:outer membrane beta-barrel family protein [Dyadobacter frigoris]
MFKNFPLTQRLPAFLFMTLVFTNISFQTFASKRFSKRAPDGGKLIGKVIEAPKNEAVSFATVAILLAKDSTVTSGAITDEKGVFTIPDVKPGNYILRITNMGYETLFVPNISVATESNITDLGTLSIIVSSQKLNEVVIRGEKAMIVEDIDKKMITIGKDMLASSSNASDLLTKLPSVSLDENGNPQVRGKGNVIVLIDGKPSTLYGSDLPTVLQSFPAELIERIDVSTTPSAKYEGDGASGVIDIITKKNKIRGLNGGARTSLGLKNNNNASGNISYRAGKLGLNASVNGQNRNMFWKRRLNRDNFLGDEPSRLEQRGTGNNKNKNLFGRFGANYDINDKNSVELSVNYSRDQSKTKSDLVNNSALLTGQVLDHFDRINQSKGNGNNLSTSFDYRRKFSKKDELLTFTANYSEGQSTNNSMYDQVDDVDSLSKYQQNMRTGKSKALFLNTDFTLPITTKATFEVGFRTRFNTNDNTNNFYLLNAESGNFEFNNTISNVFGYKNSIYTGYMNFSQKTDLWGLRAGLRLTDSDQEIDQISAGRDFSVNFLTLSPSLAISRKLDDNSLIKLNYSRRVQRPEADWLNPYTDVSDPKNIQTGNPNLRPEFTHKAEMAYSNYEENGGWGPSLFMDYSNNAITRLRTINAEGISLTQYDNIGKELNYGFETDFSQKFGDILKINGSGRFFRSEVVSALANIDNRTWSYSGNLNAFVSLPLDFKASAYVNYEGPRAIAQGTRQGVFVANMGIRKDLMEKKATLSFNIQDIFLSRAYKSQLATDTYLQNSLWQQTNRLVNLTFQYRFGKISMSGDES